MSIADSCYYPRDRSRAAGAWGFGPDIFHCNDWHTAFLPLYLKTLYRGDALLARAKSLLTIHNIGI